MKAEMIHEICLKMKKHLSPEQNRILKETLQQTFQHFNVTEHSDSTPPDIQQQNSQLINLFIAAKKNRGLL